MLELLSLAHFPCPEQKFLLQFVSVIHFPLTNTHPSMQAKQPVPAYGSSQTHLSDPCSQMKVVWGLQSQSCVQYLCTTGASDVIFWSLSVEDNKRSKLYFNS